MGVFRKQNAWWIEWYEGRRRLRKKTNAQTKTEAKKLYNQVKAKMLPRDIGLFDPRLSCAELVTRYLEAVKATRRASTFRRATFALRNFFEWCPVKQVLKLTPELVDRYIGHRRENDAKARTINLEITNLKSLCNWGVKNRLIPYNPVAQASKLKGDATGRLRFLSADEIAKLLNAARETAFHDVIYTLLKTGMRVGELTHLRWEDVDPANGLLRVGGYKDETVDHDTKNHKERHLAMDPDLTAVITRQPRRPGCAYVFATRDGSPRTNNMHREVTRLARAAGLEDVTPHTLRHTFASHLVMQGADLPSVQKLMGHSDISLTMRYAHLAQGHLRSAMSKMAVPDLKRDSKVIAGPGFERAAGNA